MPSAPAPSERIAVRVAEINVNQAAFDEKIVGVFRFDLDTRGKKGPALILLAEIASSLYVYEQFLDALCAAAERTRQLMSGVETDPMIRFEKMTQQLNEAVAQFVKTDPTPLSWNRINIFALEVSEQGICLTGVGRMTNLFLQKQANGSFRSFDLFGSLEQPAELNPQKPFASFICGDFHPGDVFFAGTGNFERLRQEIELKERLLTYPPVTAALELKQDLERRRIPDHFSGVILANVLQSTQAPVEAPTKEEEDKKTDAAQSVQDLHEEQLETAAYVESTVSPLSSSSGALFKTWKTKLLNAKNTLTERLRAQSQAATMTTKPRAATSDPLTLASLRGMNAGHGGTFTPQMRRRLLIGGAAIVVLIVGGIWIQRARNASAEQALWNAVYTQAMDRRNRADADLLYQNEGQARALVQEAYKLVDGLNENTADRKTAKTKLVQDLDSLRQRLRKEQRVDQPATVYQAASGNVSELVISDKGLVAVETQATGTTLALINNGQAQNQITLPSEVLPIVASVPSKSSVLLLGPEKQLALASFTKKTAGIVSLNGTAASAQAMNIYNNRLYVVDGTSQLIWRYSASGNGFGQEAKYLKTALPDLAKANSLAIDSNVYVGLNDGRILKFLSGEQQSWNDNAVDPTLTEVTKLWTSPDSDRIVALDAKSKRVVVFDKNGSLMSQIVSIALQQPTGLTVDAKAKKIYVSDGQRVLQFDLP